MKILFIVPYPIEKSPSQRFRFEQYFSKLQEKGITYSIQSFLNSRNWQSFFEKGNPLYKLIILIRGFLRRTVVIFSVYHYDYVFVHREITPVGPPVFEWIIAKILKRKIIYDFDDAIWTTDRTDESRLVKTLKARSKVASICSWSYKVSCGNPYLCNFALNFNSNVVLNPTTIDTSVFNTVHSRVKKQDNRITIGWTGSHSTLKYLNAILPALQQIEKEFSNVRIVVIANQKPELNLKSMSFIPWNIRSEVEDLQLIDIGIMPLPNDEWSKGKCGFKILQYMSMAIPAVASPVGVNSTLIQNGQSGFLASDNATWFEAIKRLIEDETLRASFGERGQKFVEEHYSVNSNSSNFLRLFA